MIEFDFFMQEINKKFQNEIWADYESKQFGNNLFIKCGIDLSYSHQFELYIEHIHINNYISEWTVDLKKNKILYFENKELVFISDDDEIIRIKGERYFANLLTTIYYADSFCFNNSQDCIFNPSLLNLSTILNIVPDKNFIQLKL